MTIFCPPQKKKKNQLFVQFFIKMEFEYCLFHSGREFHASSRFSLHCTPVS